MTTTAGPEQGASPTPVPPAPRAGWWRRLRTPALIVGGVVALAGLAAGATLLVWSPVHLRGDASALAGVDLPPGRASTAARAIGPDGSRDAAPGAWRRPVAEPRRLPAGSGCAWTSPCSRPAAVGWLVGDTAHLTGDAAHADGARVQRALAHAARRARR